MRVELDMQLAHMASDLDALSVRLREFFTACALPNGLWQRFALAFDEVVSNIAAYGQARGPIRVRVRVVGGEIRATVVDDGVAFNPLLLPNPDTTSGIDARPIGGLGIFLVRKTMDRVAYRRGWGLNCLRFVKCIPASINEEDRGDQ